ADLVTRAQRSQPRRLRTRRTLLGAVQLCLNRPALTRRRSLWIGRSERGTQPVCAISGAQARGEWLRYRDSITRLFGVRVGPSGRSRCPQRRTLSARLTLVARASTRGRSPLPDRWGRPKPNLQLGGFTGASGARSNSESCSNACLA